MMRVLSSRLTVLVLFLLCLVRIVAAEPIAGKSSRAHIEDQVFDTVTVNRVQGKNALDAVVHNWVVSVASDSVDSATTKVITAAAHSALVGDEIVFTSGALSGLSFNVSAVDTNTITLAQPAPSAPVAAVTFKILRFRHPEMNTDGSVTVSSADGGSGSVIPVSNSTSLKGGANAIVGYSFVVADTAEAASTTTVLNATAHSARLGDMIRFTAGTAANIGAWAEVTSVATNTITIGHALPATPANGDAFEIRRPSPLPTYAEDTAHVSGDLGHLALGVANEAFSVLGGTDGDYTPIATTRGGAVITFMTRSSHPGTDANTILKGEDNPAGSGDAGVFALSVRNTGMTTLAAALDYQAIGSGTYGNVMSSEVYDSNIALTSSVAVAEDVAIGDATALSKIGAQREDTTTTNTNASGDATYLKTDAAGRLLTTDATKGDTSWGFGSVTTASSFTQLIAAPGAGKSLILRDVICANESNAAAEISIGFNSGSEFFRIYASAATTSPATVHLDPGLATSATNQNIGFQTISQGTGSVRCTASAITVPY